MFDRFDPARLDIGWNQLAPALVTAGIAVALALLVHLALFTVLRRIARLSTTPLDDIVFRRLYSPIRWSMVAIAISLSAQADPLLHGVWMVAGKFITPALLGWVAYTVVKAFAFSLEYRAELSSDIAAARSQRTRVAILSRTATGLIIFVTVGLMLLNIPGVRDVGTTLLASAGLAALAVGAAAQPALKSLIAGLQMALTEPLRIGDLVVVDGHTGRVEEIRMSYVIVRTWDERAIIVPPTQFLDQSFENWSRTNEALTGPVYLHLDPATEIAPVRGEFLRFLDAHPLWDKRTASLLMTEARPESIELRLAMSAQTIGDLFDLRCAVREHMVEWLRSNAPDALIRRRLEVAAANARADQP